MSAVVFSKGGLDQEVQRSEQLSARYFNTLSSLIHSTSEFLKRGSRPFLRAKERFSEGHEQRPSIVSFAEAFTINAKPKCHDIKYSSVELIIVVFIITS